MCKRGSRGPRLRRWQVLPINSMSLEDFIEKVTYDQGSEDDNQISHGEYLAEKNSRQKKQLVQCLSDRCTHEIHKEQEIGQCFQTGESKYRIVEDTIFLVCLSCHKRNVLCLKQQKCTSDRSESQKSPIKVQQRWLLVRALFLT